MSRRLALPLAATVALGAWLAAPRPAAAMPAAPAAHERIVPVAGSAHELVYLTGVSARPLRTFYGVASDPLYARLSSGATRRLGRLGPDAEIFDKGPVVMVENSATTPYFHIRWWNFATGKNGSFGSNDQLAGVAPGGWLTTLYEGGNEHLIWRTFSGTATDLGDPAPPGVGYTFATGSNGLVIASLEGDEEFGAVRYMPWAHPGRFRTLRSDSNTLNRCGGVSAHDVACGTIFGSAIGLFPLDGTRPTIVRGSCDYPAGGPLTFHAEAIWLTGATTGCAHDDAIAAMTKAGHITYSPKRYHYSSQDAVVAIGRLVVSNTSQTELLALTSVGAAPSLLVATH
jgi:hypothetical protein